MSQITTGLRAVLSNPLVYETFQNLMGAKEGRRLIVEKHIRPFPGMRILDIGCGTCEILSALPYNIDYHGYDISEDYIAAAKKKFSGRGTFNRGLFDDAEAQKLQKFDLVMAIGVLHHMNEGEAAQLLRLAKSVLKDGGRILTRDPCFADGQNPVARFLISRDRGQHVRNAESYKALASAAFQNVKGELTHTAWVPYTHWTMECN